VGALPDRRLAWGIQLPVQTLTRTLREPWELDAGVDELLAVARLAEYAGAHYVGVCDHVAIPRDDYAAHMGTSWWDPVATLGFLAAHTRSVRLLTGVYVLPYRHPLQTAKSFCTLDRLSGGRVILGVGAGHVAGEFEALGLDFRRRGAETDEAIDALRHAFEHERTGHQGARWRYREMGVAPRPVQARIPIWVGGSTPAALRRVAERGDGWIPQGTPRAQMRAQIELIERHRARVRPAARIDYGFMPEPVYVGRPQWDLGPGAHLSGSPQEIAGSLRYAHELGCRFLQVRLRSRSATELLDQLEAFGREVAPLLDL
jgi:probable F420-dependent oxidoreductase